MRLISKTKRNSAPQLRKIWLMLSVSPLASTTNCCELAIGNLYNLMLQIPDPFFALIEEFGSSTTQSIEQLAKCGARGSRPQNLWRDLRAQETTRGCRETRWQIHMWCLVFPSFSPFSLGQGP